MSALMDWISDTHYEKHTSLQSLLNFKCLDHNHIGVQHNTYMFRRQKLPSIHDGTIHLCTWLFIMVQPPLHRVAF